MDPQPNQVSPDELERLAKIMVHLSEDEFKSLVDHYRRGYYTQLKGNPRDKAQQFLEELKEHSSIPWLIEEGKTRIKRFPWDPDEVIRPSKYCIVSSLPENEVQQEFDQLIKDYLFTRVERVYEGEKADYLIFDLDHPHENWLKYLMNHLPKSRRGIGSILFVTLESKPEINEIELKGNHIVSIISRYYGQESHKFKFCRAKGNLGPLLFTMIDSDTEEAMFKATNEGTIARMKSPPTQSTGEN
jgi:hypothetical protein